MRLSICICGPIPAHLLVILDVNEWLLSPLAFQSRGRGGGGRAHGVGQIGQRTK